VDKSQARKGTSGGSSASRDLFHQEVLRPFQFFTGLDYTIEAMNKSLKTELFNTWITADSFKTYISNRWRERLREVEMDFHPALEGCLNQPE
jgi:hypothetical protein